MHWTARALAATARRRRSCTASERSPFEPALARLRPFLGLTVRHHGLSTRYEHMVTNFGDHSLEPLARSILTNFMKPDEV